MKKKLKYVVTFLWFCYLIVSSILLFARGFLLTRDVQDKYASCTFKVAPFCDSDKNQDCFLKGNHENLTEKYYNAYNTCVKTESKVVLLIVDALRYDFTVFDKQNKNPLPYQNKLPIIEKLLTNFPSSTRLFKFIADPPTTTMQRLKGLTTGSLPTFIDAGSNFATSEINEDNIIDQVIKNDYKVVFMGDDTWASLYPNRFVRNYPYPSFDVWDLDTVDNGVEMTLFPELAKTDWRLLIGHFLGVDHCGHRYGPNHPEMSRKLGGINNIIERVINEMDNDTILFVIGDHGMTVTGDHGGESLDEIQAAMFVHSKQALLSFEKQDDSVKQVDLVPTLSAILGVPIPYQNLGILIYSALPSSTHTDSWKLPLFSLWGNAQQLFNYIKTYSADTNVFDIDYLDLYGVEFNSLANLITQIDSQGQSQEFFTKAQGFLEKLRVLCEEVWVQFDTFSMSKGLMFLVLSLFFMFIISDGIPLQHITHVIEGSFISICCIALLISLLIVGILEVTNLTPSFFSNFVFVVNVLSPLMFLIPIFQNWEFISMNWYSKHKRHDIVSFVCRLVLIFNILTVFSNSFINEESSILLYLLITIIFIILGGILTFSFEVNSNKKKSIVVTKTFFFLCVLILILLRTSAYFWRCRVEQEWCFTSPHQLNISKSESSKLQWAISVVSLVLLVNLCKIWLKNCGNLNGYSVSQFCAKIFPIVIVVCVAGFWVLQRVSGNKSSNKRILSYLPLSAYALSSFSMIVLVLRPVCIDIVTRNDAADENLIPRIYNKLKSNLNQRSEEIPIVCGLGTSYSAAYVILIIYLLLIWCLVLGDAFALAAFILAMMSVFLLIAASILRIKKAETIEDLLNVPNIDILGWIILSQYFFFGTGHQPAFPNINWEAAFIGTSGVFSHRYILGSLIILNTFGSYILMGISLPLLIIVPFTLFVMKPSLVGRNKEFYMQIQKGEILLYEKAKVVSASLFSLSCRYVAGHSVKVFASMLAATIHCRHLMVWNVFAPKFIFESVALFVTLVTVLLGYLFFIRVNSEIEKLIHKLNKAN